MNLCCVGSFFFFPQLAKLRNDTADERLLMKKKTQRDPLGAAWLSVMLRMDTGQPRLCLSQESNHTSKSGG